MKLNNQILNYINELHIKPFKAKDFDTITQRIKDNYLTTSRNSENYFIRNLAHIHNKNTNEPLFDLAKNDIHKNYTAKLYINTLKPIKNAKNNYDIINGYGYFPEQKYLLEKYENDVVEYSNDMETYTHKNNTDFIENMDAKYSFKKLAKVKYLDYKNKHKTPVMLTLTLDKLFRKYIKVEECVLGQCNGLQEINKDANLEELIEQSYHKLNDIYRGFYKYLKNLNKRSGDTDKLDFIMIFEPHKSLTLHLHILFYCNKIQLSNLNRTWKNYLKDLTPKQQKAQNFKMIDTNIASASSYISKYLIKEYNTDTNEISFFQQYKRYFSKLKLFRTSNFYHTTQAKIDKMYSYLTANYPDILETIRLSDIPIYEILEQFDLQGLFQFTKTKIQSTSFDRKAIKEFYDTYKDTHQSHQIKQEIINNIEYYERTTTISKIDTAIFIYNHKTLLNIFNTYNIEHNLEPEIIQPEKFYYAGMYEINELDINTSISIANNILEEELLAS